MPTELSKNLSVNETEIKEMPILEKKTQTIKLLSKHRVKS